ncbi:10390_t:CDS:1, partial [Funneliformis caledonium]
QVKTFDVLFDEYVDSVINIQDKNKVAELSENLEDEFDEIKFNINDISREL